MFSVADKLKDKKQCVDVSLNTLQHRSRKLIAHICSNIKEGKARNIELNIQT